MSNNKTYELKKVRWSKSRTKIWPLFYSSEIQGYDFDLALNGFAEWLEVSRHEVWIIPSLDSEHERYLMWRTYFMCILTDKPY